MPSRWLGSIAAQARGEQREEEELMKEGRDLLEGGGVTYANALGVGGRRRH